MKTISTSPPNSLILVMDHASGIVPETMDNRLVSTTESCVAVGCMSAYDGPTEIQLGQTNEIIPTDALIFEGEISTPSKKLSICLVTNAELLSVAVSGERTNIRIFANDLSEPNRILILFDQ